MNPDPKPLRKHRIARLLIAPLALALAVGGIRFWNLSNAETGADFYYPEWRIPALVSNAEANRRLRILGSMEAEQALPLLLEGAAKPFSEFGATWQDFVEKLPGDLAVYLPQYQTRRTHDFLSELAFNTSHPAAAEAVARMWPSWDVEYRAAFLNCLETLPGVRRSVDLALVPVLVFAMTHPDEYSSDVLAEGVAAGLTNRPSELDGALAERAHLHPVALARLSGSGFLSSRLESALAKGPASDDLQLRFWYAMTLTRCVPERHPPEQVLGDLLRRELFLSEWWFYPEQFLIQGRSFEPVVASSFFRRRCLAILGASDRDPVVQERILRVLAQVPAPDAETARFLRPWLAAGDRALFPVAMRAFLASAPLEADHVALVAAGLTNRETCASVLLWLTEAGTNAIPLQETVEALALDALPVGGEVPSGDGMQASSEEGTRDASWVPPTSGPGPKLLRPSEVVAHPDTEIPRRLLKLWPLQGASTLAGVGGSKAMPEATLQFLAERCVLRMRGDPSE